MTDSSTPPPSLRTHLAGLAGVRVRRMFGSDAYFAGGVLFAFLGDEGLVLRLPEETCSAALRSGSARQYLGRLPEGLSGWVVVAADAAVGQWLDSAQAQAQALSRIQARRKARVARARRARRKQSG